MPPLHRPLQLAMHAGRLTASKLSCAQAEQIPSLERPGLFGD